MASPVDPLSNSWQHLYERACCETDPKKLHELVSRTEEALFRRGLEIAPDGDDREERNAMTASAEGLLRIKTEVLGWPAMDSQAHAPPPNPGGPSSSSKSGSPVSAPDHSSSADASGSKTSGLADPPDIPSMPPGGSTNYPD
jgi:hypothetical protein